MAANPCLQQQQLNDSNFYNYEDAGSGEDAAVADSAALFCPSTWDTLTCWPATPVGQLAVVSCPDEFDGVAIDTTANATRLCLLNATWESRSNYRQCRPIEGHGTSTDDNIHNFVSRLIYYVGFSASIIALLVALFIFVYFRSLRCLRNTIHCHLIVAFMLKNLLWLTMNSVLPKLIDSDTTVLAQWLCKVIVALFNYLQLTTFFWMLVEGLYLHTIIVCAFSTGQLRLWYYGLVGWGAPLVFIFAWSVVKANIEDVTCWLPVENSYYDYIFIAPILCVLLVNMIFLGSIIYVLITKLQETNSVQNVQYRKAVRATVVLLPLLGVMYVLFITNPSDHHISKHVFTYFNNVLQSTQGLLVAIFYCFLNGEVRAVIASKASNWTSNRHPSTTRSRYALASVSTTG